MKELVLPLEWHSYCISIDLISSSIKFYHNDHIQAIQNFTVNHGDEEGLAKMMNRGHLGGPNFVGFISDFHIFGSSLDEKIILEWTSCNKQVDKIVQ